MTILAYNSKNKIDSSGILFYGKRLYQQQVQRSIQEGEYIDLWYSKPLYGKVDTNFNLVHLSSQNLKPVQQGRRRQQDVFALNFVADAFNAMRIYLQELSLSKKIRSNSFFNPLVAHKGWKSVNKMYQDNLTASYNMFVNTYLAANGRKMNLQIRKFDDYLPIFLDFLNFTTENGVPLTKSGFISKSGCPHSISGLVIEIADEKDYSDDSIKYRKYVSHPDFNLFKTVAKQFGFYIDANVPWKLIANLESPAWQDNPILKEIIDSYYEEGMYSSQMVFERNYHYSHVADVQSLRVIARRFYTNLIANEEPLYVPKVCRKNNRITRISPHRVRRPRISMEEVNKKYNDVYWLRLYSQLRFKEMQVSVTPHQMKAMMTEIQQEYVSGGFNLALKYINEELTSGLEAELEKFLVARTKRENPLTVSKTPDIIL